MTDDIYEPLDRYRTEFQEKFASLTREMFASLLEASGVDEKKNAETVANIVRLEKEHSTVRRRQRLWQFLVVIAAFAIIILVLVAVFALLDGFNSFVEGDRLRALLKTLACAVGVTLFGVLLGKVLVPKYRRSAAVARDLSGQLEEQKAQAWAQVNPLNQLYDWDMAAKLITQTIPNIHFDPFFTTLRLQELQQDFDLDDSFNEGQSVRFAQSGSLDGNPFVLGETLKMRWGEKTYTGHKRISWTVQVKDKDGKERTEYRHETLVARVTKPIPVYSEEKFLLYGNKAAPKLSFSRTPSALSDDKDGIIHTLHKKRVISKLKKFSSNLKDESQYTLMANHDFEAFFHATDRNDEVAFRLLFTPLAQQQMLRLLRDKEKIGFGDDFTFVKKGKLNAIYPKHLHEIQLDNDPKRFASYHVKDARTFFQKTCEEYFKAFYFALAPLLTIPLYQETSHNGVTHDSPEHWEASFWEHESLANYHGEKFFQHPKSITRNILKTQKLNQIEGASVIAVTASGYKGQPRTDSQAVRGGDGRLHSVNIEWTEYLPVEQTKTMLVAEQAGRSQPDCRQQLAAIPEKWQQLHANRQTGWQNGIYRRSILSFLE